MKSLAEIRRSLDADISEKGEKPYQAVAKYLSKNLTPDLSADEIAKLLAIVEQIKVDGSTIGSDLFKAKKDTLDSFAGVPFNLPKKLLGDWKSAPNEISHLLPLSLDRRQNATFLSIMGELHTSLTESMKKVLIRANSEKGYAFELPYPESHVNSSMPFQRIASNSQESQLPDLSTIDRDISRHLATFSIGEVVEVNKQQSIVFNPFPITGDSKSIKSNIESFAGDKINIIGSRANKIFNFGGQFLQTELTLELRDTLELNGQAVVPQLATGKTHWRKMPKGEIQCDVTVNIFSAMSGDKIYILNSEGDGLTEVNLRTSRGAEVLSRLPALYEKDLPLLKAPIATLKVTLELTGEKNEYYFTAKQASLTSNTNQLQSLRQQRKLPTDYFQRVNVSDFKDINHSIRLLKSFNDQEWGALKVYCNKHPDMKIKIARIFVYARMNRYIGKNDKHNIFETDLLEKKLATIYGEKEFKEALKASTKAIENKYKIDSYINRLNEFFKKLKSNNRELSLQDPVGVLNDIKKLSKKMKEEGCLEHADSLLKYILFRIAQGIDLTVLDQAKINKIYDAVKTDFPIKHPVVDLIFSLQASMNNISYSRIKMLKSPPSPQDSLPSDTIALFKKNNDLIAYWPDGSGHFKSDNSKSFKIQGDKAIQLFLDSLPKPGKDSKDQLLIKRITSKFGCTPKIAGDFTEKILLQTKIKSFAEKISNARETIRQQLDSFKERPLECQSLSKLNDKLSTIQRDLNDSVGLKLPQGYLQLKINETSNAINTAYVTVNKPSNIFMQLFEAIRSLFFKPQGPALSKALQEVESQLPKEETNLAEIRP